MTPVATVPATLDDLMRFGGKAELVNGRIEPIMPTGFWPGEVARRITQSLGNYVSGSGRGVPVQDNIGYGFPTPLPSGRQSLSPDASLYTGPLQKKWMKYISGHPDFAAEVRSENDYTPAKDREYELKRKDYFFAGTLVVWDVDPVAETITRYTAPDIPTVFRRGDVADAEPAVPGWRLKVDDVFA